MTTLTIVRKSVNSKRLVDALETVVTDAITEILGGGTDNWSGRDWFVELMNAFLFDLVSDGKIDNWDVICDARNNKMSDMNNGILHVTIAFQQKDCVNVTQLICTVKVKDDISSDEDTM